MNVIQAAKYLGKHRWTIQRWCKSGKLKAEKFMSAKCKSGFYWQIDRKSVIDLDRKLRGITIRAEVEEYKNEQRALRLAKLYASNPVEQERLYATILATISLTDRERRKLAKFFENPSAW